MLFLNTLPNTNIRPQLLYMSQNKKMSQNIKSMKKHKGLQYCQSKLRNIVVQLNMLSLNKICVTVTPGALHILHNPFCGHFRLPPVIYCIKYNIDLLIFGLG